MQYIFFFIEKKKRGFNIRGYCVHVTLCELHFTLIIKFQKLQ